MKLQPNPVGTPPVRNSIRLRARAAALASLVTGWLAALIFSAAPTISQAKSLAIVPPVSAPACTDLLTIDFTVAADNRRLESDEAPMRVDTATEVTTGVPQPYCKVTGNVSQAIRFEIHLPTQGWTQRYLQFSCGG